MFDWSDIEGSMDRALENRPGWQSQLTTELAKVHQHYLHSRYPSSDGEHLELPEITDIKQKMGLLTIHLKGGTAVIAQDILRRADQISLTCECCGNTATRQRIRGWNLTVCCWCYNSELADRNERSSFEWPEVLSFDVVEKFPDLVRTDLTSLKPSIGAGWFPMLKEFLEECQLDVEIGRLSRGSVEISDIKSRRDGRIQINFHRYDDRLDDAIRQLEFESTLTCAKCGHVGDVVRAKDKSDLLCAHCLIKAIRA